MADPYAQLNRTITDLEKRYRDKLAQEAAARSQQGVAYVDLVKGLCTKVANLKTQLDATKLQEEEGSKHRGYFPGGEFEFGKTKDAEQWLEKFKDFAHIKNFDVDETLGHLKLYTKRHANAWIKEEHKKRAPMTKAKLKTLYEDFLKAFSGRDQYSRQLRIDQPVQKRDEPVEEYYARTLDYFDKVDGATDYEIASSFLLNLRPNLKVEVIRKRPDPPTIQNYFLEAKHFEFLTKEKIVENPTDDLSKVIGMIESAAAGVSNPLPAGNEPPVKTSLAEEKDTLEALRSIQGLMNTFRETQADQMKKLEGIVKKQQQMGKQSSSTGTAQQSAQPSQTSIPQMRAPRCNFCGRPGHVEETCFRKPNNVIQMNSGQQGTGGNNQWRPRNNWQNNGRFRGNRFGNQNDNQSRQGDPPIQSNMSVRDVQSEKPPNIASPNQSGMDNRYRQAATQPSGSFQGADGGANLN